MIIITSLSVYWHCLWPLVEIIHLVTASNKLGNGLARILVEHFIIFRQRYLDSTCDCLDLVVSLVSEPELTLFEYPHKWMTQVFLLDVPIVGNTLVLCELLQATVFWLRRVERLACLFVSP